MIQPFYQWNDIKDKYKSHLCWKENSPNKDTIDNDEYIEDSEDFECSSIQYFKCGTKSFKQDPQTPADFIETSAWSSFTVSTSSIISPQAFWI